MLDLCQSIRRMLLVKEFYAGTGMDRREAQIHGKEFNDRRKDVDRATYAIEYCPEFEEEKHGNK